MRRRITADIELSDIDMQAIIELIAQHAITFTMHDVAKMPAACEPTARPRNHGHRSARHQQFPRNTVVYCTDKSPVTLTQSQREVLAALYSKFGSKPFNKGTAAGELRRELGESTSSTISLLCQRGHIAPVRS